MGDQAYWNNGDRPRVFINWSSFTAQGIDSSWQGPVTDAVINAYTRWMNAGADCRFQFWNYTDRSDAQDGEIIISMNERHADTTRIASAFVNWRRANIVVHRKNGSNLTPWPLVPFNAQPGQIDLQGVLTHEFGHCFWLDHSSSAQDTMHADYAYHRQRFGPWEGDVARLKALYRDMDRNRLREFRSTDGGSSWFAQGNQLTNYNNYQARTCLTPGITSIGNSGLYALGWSHPNRIPTWLRTDGVNFLFNGWVYYGGERSVHGPALADEPGGLILMAWVHNDDNGSIRVVRSTNQGASWAWAATPVGATTFGTPGLVSTMVGGRRAWVLAWAHFDRSDHTGTGRIRASVSYNDGGSWSQPTVVPTSFDYRSLVGVSLAAAPDNRIVLAFAWGGESIAAMNLVRSLDCEVSGDRLVQRGTGFSGARTRAQPAVAYDPGHDLFHLAFREQNFLTSLRVARKEWLKPSTWSAAQQLPNSTSSTGPALAHSRGGNNLLLWYGGE
ncbi:matrixin family metalloprotease [Streptomyces sp. NPDC056486]|uniref:matrixin family metalloprotease n=1 Tax=Streptomyces sp. NPDC056486 TaxID=3345835 RepID=UPI003690A124